VETALILCVPEAEELVGKWRQQFDPSAAEGVPPHITVLAPFRSAAEIGAELMAELHRIMRAFAPLRLAFSQVKRFTDCLWLQPEPAQRVVEITRAVVERFPDCPPYGGAFAEIIPHLTVAYGVLTQFDRIEEELLGRLRQGPIQTRISGCSLYAREPGRWRELQRFPFLANG
jgi:2'-5' RNA ligase